MSDEILIFDLETYTPGSRPDPEKDEHRIFGCYSYKTNKYYCLTKPSEIQKVINAHKFIVGFNNKEYDCPILIRAGISFEYKIIVDMREIFKKRARAMKTKKGMLNDLIMIYSLDYITRLLDLVDDESAKKHIDYSVFKKPTWTVEETKEIVDYNRRDLEVSKKLLDWLEDYFDCFKSYINEEDVRKKKYLTVSVPSFTYKAICHTMNWNEDYDHVDKEPSEKGGYVSYPAGEKFEGNLYLFDFASLYPHVMIMTNSFGRKKIEDNNDRPTWNGGNVWRTNGIYYSDKLDGISELQRRWYKQRVEYIKIKDRREYTIKIMLNSISGMLEDASFKHIYDMIARSDVTGLGRQWIFYARKTFRDNGYIVCYSDTDSSYILDPFNDMGKMMKLKQQIIDYIKSTVPFPQDTFDFVLESPLKYLFFFKGKNEDDEDDTIMDEDDYKNRPKGYMKKNYIYVTTDNKLTIKNLGIRKKSNSPLSKKIFNEYLVPDIINKGIVKFSRTYIRNLIIELLDKDITLAAMRKDVGDLKDYDKSPTGIHAQISKKYGPGIHFLIPNTRGLGVGIGKKFITIEEFKEHRLGPEHIDLDNVWSELSYFIKDAPTKNIFEYG